MCVVTARPGDPQGPAAAGVEVDLAIRLPAAGLFLAGRVNDPHHLVNSVTLRGTSGFRHRLDDGWAWTRGSDAPVRTNRVEPGAPAAPANPPTGSGSGFVELVPAAADACSTVGWFLEVTRRDRGTTVASIRFDGRSPATLVRAVLDRVDPDDQDLERIIDRHVGPAVRALVGCRPHRPRAPLRIPFGDDTTAPRLSVCVPMLEPRGDLDVNLACFTVDPELRDAEILIVTRRDHAAPIAAALRRFGAFYRLRGCVVASESIASTLEAIRLGAREAAADRLLVLGADVYPMQTGWLSRLVRALEDSPEGNLVSPTLLYEDDSIRYAGCDAAFETSGAPHVVPRLAGYPRSWATERHVMPTAAVSLDCLLAKRDTLVRLGRFPHRFAGTAFAQTDFAMRCRTLGCGLRWAPSVALYALDADAPPDASGGATAVVDSWLFARAWRLPWPFSGAAGSAR